MDYLQEMSSSMDIPALKGLNCKLYKLPVLYQSYRQSMAVHYWNATDGGDADPDYVSYNFVSLPLLFQLWRLVNA